MNPQDPKYQQKSKAISLAKPNYFVHFAMRHPVNIIIRQTLPSNYFKALMQGDVRAMN